MFANDDDHDGISASAPGEGGGPRFGSPSREEEEEDDDDVESATLPLALLVRPMVAETNDAGERGGNAIVVDGGKRGAAHPDADADDDAPIRATPTHDFIVAAPPG